MSEASADPDAGDGAPKKKSKALLFGLVGAVLLGGATFYGVFSGLIPLPFGAGAEQAEGYPESTEDLAAAEPGKPAEPVSFIDLDEMVISLGDTARARHLRVRVSIEVAPPREKDVLTVKPRIIDVLNTYLRAVDERDLEVPRAMMRLRAQMLRRIQLVTPEGSVRNLLIQEFVLS